MQGVKDCEVSLVGTKCLWWKGFVKQVSFEF